MHQRQSTTLHRNPGQSQTINIKPVASLPPVLFSLPDLSDTCESQPAGFAKPLTTYSDSVATSAPVVIGISKTQAPQSFSDTKSFQKSSNLLNAAIGFLAVALLLIGVKLYSDGVSEKTRTNQRLVKGPTAPIKGESSGSFLHTSNDPLSPSDSTIHKPHLNSQTTESVNTKPTPFNIGLQKPNFQINVVPANHAPIANADSVEIDSNSLIEPSKKTAIEIFDPVVSASFPAETPGALSPLATYSQQDNTIQQDNIIQEDKTYRVTPINPEPECPTTPLQKVDKPNPNSIQANSLNTRDIILLRQGKSIDLVHRETAAKTINTIPKSNGSKTNSVSSSGTIQLTGEPYPPVRQKYEPIGIPASTPTSSRPTSMEIHEPPKPYQPIGSSLQ